MKTIKIKPRGSKGMSLIEFTLLAAIVCVCFLGMSVFLKRSISGKWKQSIDIFGHGRQYDPATTGGG
jgi:Flp pilus assembly pilin Flp